MHTNQDRPPGPPGARQTPPSAASSNRPEGLFISAPSLAALASVISAHSFDALLIDGSIAAAALQDAVRAVVNEARAGDPLRVERLIVTLRSWWRSLPTVRRRADEEQAERLWSELLRRCIEEFYSGRLQS
jgi:hypothetical protein